jgi:membrane protease YdiL (CAAX protease family)
MDGVIEIAAIVALLLVAGGAIGLARRAEFSPVWLLAAAGLVLLNDFLLTRGHGLLPHLLPPAHWNWQGKILALAATLAIASLPAVGWRRSGLTLAQAPGSLRPCAIVALVYCAVFTVLAFVFPDRSPASAETIAFQLTLPGLEEEPFYRGVLLLCLDRAFRGRIRLLGVDWGWGAILSCALFGLAHAFSYRHGQFALDPATMAVTALPSFIAVWIRLRSGSVAIPILMHNFGNSVSLIL